MTNYLTPHIPGCCISSEEDFAKPIPFTTIDELMNIGTVKQSAVAADFLYFAMSGEQLMEVVSDGDGEKAFPVGRIEHPEEIHLPKWIPRTKYRAEMLDGEIVTLEYSEVRSSSSDDYLVLQNGLTVKRLPIEKD